MRTKGRGSQGYENLVSMKYSGFTVFVVETQKLCRNLNIDVLKISL